MTTPTFRTERIGNQTLILADCREVLESLTADCFLTDPFYGIDGGNNDFGKGDYIAEQWEDTPEMVLQVAVPAIAHLASIMRGAVTPGYRCMSLYPKPADIGCFWTPAASGRGPWGFNTFNPIFYYGRDYRAGGGQMPTGKQVTERATKNGHPCPKPLEAWKWLLEKVSMEGETVIDPFMGSATTLVACQQLNRHGIGIEICPTYFDIACERVEWAVRGLKPPPLPKHEEPSSQVSLF